MPEIFYKLKNKINFLKHNFGKIIFLFFIFLILLATIYFYNHYLAFGNLQITFLDVGQGDAIFIETPSHKKIILDSGPNEKILAAVDKQMGSFRKQIDLAILTHADQDHVAGFISLFQKYNILEIIWNGDINQKTRIWEILQKEISIRKNQIANCGDMIDFQDGVNLFILHPESQKLFINNTNINSLVILLIYKHYSFLFTGDIDAEVERKLFFNLDKCFTPTRSSTTSDIFKSSENINLENLNKINSALKKLTVLKVSHHGSNTASQEDFLKKIKPVYSIISAAKENKYHLPHSDVLSRLKKYSKYILRTDESGNIKFIISDSVQTFEIQKEK